MLYLIRHAEASDGEPDAKRPLSGTGRKQVQRLGAFLKRYTEPPPPEIWHSPLLRAQETALLLAERAGWEVGLRSVESIKPDDNPSLIAPKLESFQHSLAIVGHNPHLTLLATLLVTGRCVPPAFVVRKCAVIALEPARGRGEGCWVVEWQVAPELLL
jgi:phosphohistidine phosphatase